MSMVYITKHNENIYNYDKLDKGLEDEKIAFQLIHNTEGTRYVSKYHKKVIKKKFDVINVNRFNKIIASKPGIGYHKTLGYAQYPLKNPCDFLRKNEGIKWKRVKEHICGKFPPPEPIPRVSELPKKKPKVIKNMIKINIEKLKKTATKQPKPRFAITNHGETRELCNSGSMPAYIFSPNFGRLPNYIIKYNKMLCERQKACQDQFSQYEQSNGKANQNQFTMFMLDPQERIQVIEGLKKNWYEKQLIFQKLPVVVTSVKNKRKLEMDLHQLEEDIVLLEYNPKIYICN